MERQNSLLGLIGICFGVLIVATDFSIIFTILPAIQNYFSASITEMQWVMNIFGIFAAVFMIFMGRAADHIGKKKMFVIGLFIFGIASFLAGFSERIGYLIVCRGFQGLATAILLPVSQAVARDIGKTEKGGTSAWTMVASIGMAIGPFLGGVIVHYLSWRWVFFINPIIAVISLAIVLSVYQEEKEKSHVKDLDYKGLFLLFIMISSIVIALVEGPILGWSSVATIALFAIFVVSSIIFVLFEKNQENPLIDPRFFLNRNFLSSSVVAFVFAFFIWGLFFLLPLYLRIIRTDSYLLVGATMLFFTIPVVLFSSAVNRLIETKGVRKVILIGLLFLLITTFLMGNFSEKTSYLFVVISFLIFGIGWVFVWAPALNGALQNIPKQIAGLASGTAFTLQDLGGNVALALLGSYLKMKMLFSNSGKTFVVNLQNEHLSSIARTEFLQGFSGSMWILFGFALFAFIVVVLVMPSNSLKADREE